jgi:hypothetical protein
MWCSWFLWCSGCLRCPWLPWWSRWWPWRMCRLRCSQNSYNPKKKRLFPIYFLFFPKPRSVIRLKIDGPDPQHCLKQFWWTNGKALGNYLVREKILRTLKIIPLYKKPM